MSNQKKTAVALGLFDGVHQGHRAVLQAALRQKKHGMMPAAFTFHSEMAAVKGAAGFIYPTDLKTWIMETECGMEQIFAPPFELVSGLSGDDFARKILHEHMNAAFVSCGQDFRFGKDARWDAKDLVDLGEMYGFAVEIVDEVRSGGKVISSSTIRTLLQNGELKAANLLLGSPYMLHGEVVHGKRLGRTIGFATINQNFVPGQIVPKFGVYASETCTPEGWYPSVTNIGIKPTVTDEGIPLAETHIIDYAGDLYGRHISVILTKRLRDEQRFDNLEALVEQMDKDLIIRRQLSKNYHEFNT